MQSYVELGRMSRWVAQMNDKERMGTARGLAACSYQCAREGEGGSELVWRRYHSWDQSG